MKTQIILPEYILNMMSRLRAAGYEAFVAGGAVRDGLSGMVPDDFDLCTSALPSETERVFAGEKMIRTGIRHGTITVMAGKRQVEITTYRTEGSYSDGRHPDNVQFVTELKKDMSRRDFTVNAMAYSPETGVIDYFDGIKDLKNGILRCVGNPDTRFSEDGLRIMRALRFMSVRGFLPDPATAEAIHRCAYMLEKVASERIDRELLKFLEGSRAAEILDHYRDVFARIIPELSGMFDFDQKSPYHNRDVWNHTLAAVKAIRPEPQLRMTMLLHDIAKPVVFVEDENGRGHFRGHQQRGSEIAGTILKRMKFSNTFIEETVTLIREHDRRLFVDRPLIRRCLNQLGEKTFRKLLEVQMADAAGKYEKYVASTEERLRGVRSVMEKILSEGDCYTLSSLAVSGTDLINGGIPEGREIGKILSFLLDEVIEDRLPNEKNALLSAAKKRAEDFFSS